MMLFARDATLHFLSQRLFGYFCNVRIPFLNEQTNTCPISSNLFINPNFFGFYYFQIIWKYNTETRCREQKAKGDENNTAVPFSMTRKKNTVSYLFNLIQSGYRVTIQTQRVKACLGGNFDIIGGGRRGDYRERALDVSHFQSRADRNEIFAV